MKSFTQTRRLAIAALSVAFALSLGCSNKNFNDAGDVADGGSAISGKDKRKVQQTPSSVNLDRVHFEFNRFSLTDRAKKTIRRNFKKLKKHSKAQLVLEGHCDERGSNEYNLSLGERRSQSVKNYMVGLGFNARRTRTVSYGEERPRDLRSSEKAWSKNRRVEFIVPKVASR